jgi:hypothetical protein
MPNLKLRRSLMLAWLSLMHQRDGSKVRAIKGKLVPPGGDWGHRLPSGVFRLDVRGTIQTDDGEIIFVSYNGISQCPKESNERLSKGELIKSADCYFLAAPTFETNSEKYGWLNGLQAVAKMIEFKRADHVTYDIFALK